MDNVIDFIGLYSSTKFIIIEKFTVPQSFAIITAHNPNGVICNVNENNIFDANLRLTLHAIKEIKCFSPLIGCSPDMSHHEDSYAVEISKIHAFEVSKKFNQNAFYWVEKGQLTIVPVKLDGMAEHNIGSFKKRVMQVN
jgi:hypothetical protein